MADSISKQDVQDVIDFAQAIAAMSGEYGMYSPMMSNQLLQNLNNNPRIPSLESIQQALSSYKEDAGTLQSFMDFMNNYDMVFKRTLYSYANVLAFDLSITCTNAYSQQDYNSKEYEEDKKRVYDFLDKFKYKDEFRKCVVEVLLHGVYFTWFRKTKWKNQGMKYALQIMPQQYCMLTGYWEKGLLYDFDYSYFLNPGVDIEGFDPSMAKMYRQMFIDGDGRLYNYRPTQPLNRRTGKYAYWGQTSPEDGSWVFKQNPENFNTTPYLAPFLKDAITSAEIQKLQRDKDIIGASAILAGEIRLFDSAKSQKANQFAIDPKTLGGFMAKAKAGLGNLLKIAALPLENTKFYQFVDSNSDMYENTLATTAGVGSGISRVIYSSDRMSNAEIEAGIIDQYNTMKPLYYQFENFLDFFVNKLTKKYKFHFTFDGCSYPFEREKRFDKLTKMADKGLVMNASQWASAIGVEPQVFERSLAESKYTGWVEEYSQLLMNVNTANTGSAGESGRPKKEDGDLSDSGELNRDSEEGI